MSLSLQSLTKLCNLPYNFFPAPFVSYCFIFLSLPPFNKHMVVFLPAASQCILRNIRCCCLPVVIKKKLVNISSIGMFLTKCWLRKESKNFLVKCHFYRNTQARLCLKCLPFNNNNNNNSAAWARNWKIARVVRSMSSSKFHDMNNISAKKPSYLKISARVYWEEQRKSFEKGFINIHYNKARNLFIVHCF